MFVDVTATNSFGVRRPCPNTMGPEHRHPVLEAPGPVRDLGEIAHAGALLLCGEGAMIRRHHRQGARGETGPEAVLMLLVSEGRRHHAPRGMVPVGVEILAFRPASGAGSAARPRRACPAAWRAGSPHAPPRRRHARRKAAPPAMSAIIHPARFVASPSTWVRPRIGHAPSGPGNCPSVQKLLLQLGHHVAVLGMDHGDGTQLRQPLESRRRAHRH